MLEVLPGTTRLTVSVAVLELSHKVCTHRPTASTRHTRRAKPAKPNRRSRNFRNFRNFLPQPVGLPLPQGEYSQACRFHPPHTPPARRLRCPSLLGMRLACAGPANPAQGRDGGEADRVDGPARRGDGERGRQQSQLLRVAPNAPAPRRRRRPAGRPHMHRDCAHICTGTELTLPTSAPGLCSHLHRDWAHPLAPSGPQPSAHPRACAGDGLAVA